MAAVGLSANNVHNVAFKKPPIGKRGYDEEDANAADAYAAWFEAKFGSTG